MLCVSPMQDQNFLMEFTLLTSEYPILIGADASCAVWKGKSTHLEFFGREHLSAFILLKAVDQIESTIAICVKENT